MNDYAPCPKCRASSAQRMKFTWWGGVLGPKVLTHVKCAGCGTRYNGKTGTYNTARIAIYMTLVGLISFGLMFVLAAAYVLVNMSR